MNNKITIRSIINSNIARFFTIFGISVGLMSIGLFFRNENLFKSYLGLVTVLATTSITWFIIERYTRDKELLKLKREFITSFNEIQLFLGQLVYVLGMTINSDDKTKEQKINEITNYFSDLKETRSKPFTTKYTTDLISNLSNYLDKNLRELGEINEITKIVNFRNQLYTPFVTFQNEVLLHIKSISDEELFMEKFRKLSKYLQKIMKMIEHNLLEPEKKRLSEEDLEEARNFQKSILFFVKNVDMAP